MSGDRLVDSELEFDCWVGQTGKLWILNLNHLSRATDSDSTTTDMILIHSVFIQCSEKATFKKRKSVNLQWCLLDQSRSWIQWDQGPPPLVNNMLHWYIPDKKQVRPACVIKWPSSGFQWQHHYYRGNNSRLTLWMHNFLPLWPFCPYRSW